MANILVHEHHTEKFMLNKVEIRFFLRTEVHFTTSSSVVDLWGSGGSAVDVVAQLGSGGSIGI